MAENASALLQPWSSYYVMTGSSAAALTGLMFVVITLVMGTERLTQSRDGLSTFSTPTVVHFCSALFVSALLAAPWHTLAYVAGLLALAGLGGIVYVSRIALRTRNLNTYAADVEDWSWYIVLPLLAYAATLGGGIGLFFAPRLALFALAGSALVQIFNGIHNAWDVVTFIAISEAELKKAADSGKPRERK
jgi:hypothetical protein